MDVTTWTVMAAIGAGATRKLATDPLHGTGLVPMAAVAVRMDRLAVFPESGELTRHLDGIHLPKLGGIVQLAVRLAFLLRA